MDKLVITNVLKKSSWLAISAVLALSSCAKQPTFHYNEGAIFGTFYHIQYLSTEDLHQEILDSLHAFDASLSMFNDSSTISRINRNENPPLDAYFCQMFRQAEETSRVTHGAFDITVKPLVEYWGFGKNFGRKEQKQESLDSIRQIIGFQKLSIRDNHLVKQDTRLTLDASAIAKGQGCDVIAQVLRRHGIRDFLVEIGGEITCAGHNPEGQRWAVGVNKPVDDPDQTTQDIQEVLHLTDCGMATSGNYRQFYVQDGQRRAHTIDPRTGRPAQHDLLSATVITTSCMRADAYATAFMVLGSDSALAICRRDTTLHCYLICANPQDTTKYIIKKTGL